VTDPDREGVFAHAPFIVIWEVTRACALACVHCRAEAIARRHPDELTTDEGKRLIDRVAGFGGARPPLLVLTGGDPMRRRDLAELVRHAVGRGLSVGLTPSGTAAVTHARLEELRDAGVARLAVSVDGSTAAAHDAFRRVRGSHRYTMRIVDDARRLGLPLQINTTVARQTVDDLPALAELVGRTGAVLWALFFLIPVLRARAEHALTAAEIEGVLLWAAELQQHVPFGIKTTEAPHYHRVLAQRKLAIGDGSVAPRALGRAGRAVTDGNGFLFVDHVGRICPSGFLPLPAGNVRTDHLVRVYRQHPLFRSLRRPDRLGGRCGACEFRAVCGGSRARAYAATGDPLAEDPGCDHVPSGARPAAASAVA
jgi:radical SAM protein with 4Fe4S-binding SPASM domain